VICSTILTVFFVLCVLGVIGHYQDFSAELDRQERELERLYGDTK
jgi:hypothetical protein